MPFLGREKGCSPRYRRSEDEFVVFLQGIPAHCRWQELKDLVRQTALHIRQAVVYDDNQGFPTGVGQIIIKSEDEAWRTYLRLSTNGWEGQSLVVTLARTSTPTKPIAGPTRSPPAMMPRYVSGRSTPPCSRGNMSMPPSPISPEFVHSAIPAYTYAEYGHMMSAMTMPPQPFIPMMPDPMAQPMQSFPPSPLTHCSMYDAAGWNMMPMYPVSPIQHFHDSVDTYPRYHPGKPQVNSTEPNTPSDWSQQAVYTKNLHASTTTAGLQSPFQGAGAVEQCNVTVSSNARENQAQTNGSAIMSSIEEAKRAASVIDNMTTTGSQLSLNMDQRPGMPRGGSWDAAMASQEDLGLLDQVAGDNGSEWHDRRQDVLGQKAVEHTQPLVVDGSGLQKTSLELLSTSAPS